MSEIVQKESGSFKRYHIYGFVKLLWRGRIETKWIRCYSPFGIMNSTDGKPTHMTIYAHYRDQITHENKKIDLGDTFKVAYHELIDSYFRARTSDFHHMM